MQAFTHSGYSLPVPGRWGGICPVGPPTTLESARVGASIEHEVLPRDVARLRAADERAHLAELGGGAEAAGRVLGLTLASDVVDRASRGFRDGRDRGA